MMAGRLIHERCHEKTNNVVFNRSDTNQPVQTQNMARSLKFWFYKVEEQYYPCNENKGAHQLGSYCKANLRLCLRICREANFDMGD